MCAETYQKIRWHVAGRAKTENRMIKVCQCQWTRRKRGADSPSRCHALYLTPHIHCNLRTLNFRCKFTRRRRPTQRRTIGCASLPAADHQARLRQGDVPERLIHGGKMHLILEMIRHVRMGREPERLCELDVKQREGVQKRKETLCAIEWGKAAFFAK